MTANGLWPVATLSRSWARSSCPQRTAYSRRAASAAPGQQARWGWPHSQSPPPPIRTIGIRPRRWVHRPAPQQIGVGSRIAPSCLCLSSHDPFTDAGIHLTAEPPLYEEDLATGGVAIVERTHVKRLPVRRRWQHRGDERPGASPRDERALRAKALSPDAAHRSVPAQSQGAPVSDQGLCGSGCWQRAVSLREADDAPAALGKVVVGCRQRDAHHPFGHVTKRRARCGRHTLLFEEQA
jgi:hypothetical protein